MIPNDSPASSGLGRLRGDRINPSIGVGSAVVFDESVIFKAKDLSLIKIETIPVDAAQYRGWKNAFLTKASSVAAGVFSRSNERNVDSDVS